MNILAILSTWNNYNNRKTIYPKLEVHLRTYLGKWKKEPAH